MSERSSSALPCLRARGADLGVTGSPPQKPFSVLFQRFGSKEELVFAAMTPPAPDMAALLDPGEPYRDPLSCLEHIAAGATELSPLSMRDWGDLAAYSLDPDGHVVAFAQRMAAGG